MGEEGLGQRAGDVFGGKRVAGVRHCLNCLHATWVSDPCPHHFMVLDLSGVVEGFDRAMKARWDQKPKMWSLITSIQL